MAKGEAVLGGEESAGMSITGHVPEKDGILACALVTEMVANTGKTVRELLGELFQKVGPIYTKREDVTVHEKMRERLDMVLAQPPDSFGGSRIVQVNQMDGCKLLMDDGSWFLLRPSGTEPIVRCYGEAKTFERLKQIMQAGHALLMG